MRPGDILREKTGSKAIGRIVRQRDRLFLRLESHDGRDRPEDLLARDRHVVRDVEHHGGLVEARAEVAALPAEHDAGALRNRVGHEPFDVVDGLAVDQRAGRDAAVIAIAN